MTTPEGPYRYEPDEGDAFKWWTIRCGDSPEILNVEAATARLNAQHAEIERLRSVLAAICDRFRDLHAELQSPDFVLEYFGEKTNG
jgi:hypothetical protein